MEMVIILLKEIGDRGKLSGVNEGRKDVLLAPGASSIGFGHERQDRGQVHGGAQVYIVAGLLA